MTNDKLFFLIDTTSYDENIFFITYGSIDIKKEDSTKLFFSNNKSRILLLVDKNEYDWFGYFVKSETKQFEIECYYKGFSLKFFNEYLSVPDSILNCIQVEKSFMFSNLYLVHEIVRDIKANTKEFWISNLDYKPNKTSSLCDKIVTTNEFLLERFQEGYSISSFGIKYQNPGYNENFNLINFLSKDHLYLSEAEKRFLKFEFKSLYTGYTFCIERIKTGLYPDYYFKIKITKKAKDDYYRKQINSDNYDLLFETEVAVMSKYKEENSYFIFDKKAYKIFTNLLSLIDNKFRFIWIDEDYFFNKFKNRSYNKIENSLWSHCELFGIHFKSHDFYQRYSDFGSDNDILLVYGDSKYSKFRNKKDLKVKHNPANHCDTKNPGKYYDLEENVFNYFYENKKFVLINFDEIPYDSRKYKCSVDILSSLIEEKVINIPNIYIEETFFLTSDLILFL